MISQGSPSQLQCCFDQATNLKWKFSGTTVKIAYPATIQYITHMQVVIHLFTWYPMLIPCFNKRRGANMSDMHSEP